MRQFISHSEEDTASFAEKICTEIPAGTAVAFTGGMGAGKTAFVRGALKAYDNTSFVSSPTFALVNDYGGTPHIFHFDMYRITTADDLYATGFFDYLDKDSILFIEWSENIRSELPENTVYIDISPGSNENERIITVKGENF